MGFLDFLGEFLYNLSIFGIRPFRGLYTAITSEGLWSFLISVLIIVFLINKIFGNSFIKIITRTMKLICRLTLKFAKNIVLRFIDVYSFIMIKKDSEQRNYLWSEYWISRIITLKGIVSTDTTGANNLFIEHPMLIRKTINVVVISKRIFANLFLLIKNILVKS